MNDTTRTEALAHLKIRGATWAQIDKARDLLFQAGEKNRHATVDLGAGISVEVHACTVDLGAGITVEVPANPLARGLR